MSETSRRLAATLSLTALLALALLAGAVPAGAVSGSPSSPPAAVATATTLRPGAPAVAPIGPQLPAPPATVPLTTRPESAHVDPLLAKLSLAGFALFVLLLIIQAVLTRPKRRGRWTL